MLTTVWELKSGVLCILSHDVSFLNYKGEAFPKVKNQKCGPASLKAGQSSQWGIRRRKPKALLDAVFSYFDWMFYVVSGENISV